MMEYFIVIVLSIIIAIPVGYLCSHLLWGSWFEREKKKMERGG